MKTIDTNPEAKLALVHNKEKWFEEGNETRYVHLDEAPELEPAQIPQTYLQQLHYVASHIAIYLFVHDRLIDGKKAPRSGWTRWKP